MTNYLPIELAPDADELETSGLYQALRARGVHIRLARQRIGAKPATKAEARLLDEKAGAPLLTMSRTAFDDSGRAVEVRQPLLPRVAVLLRDHARRPLGFLRRADAKSPDTACFRGLCVCSRGKGTSAEGRAKRLERGVAVTRRPALQPDGAAEPDVAQRLRDGGVVDLAGARFAAPGYVRHLNLTDRVTAATDQFDEIPLADLRVIQVEHHLDVRMIDAPRPARACPWREPGVRRGGRRSC